MGPVPGSLVPSLLLLLEGGVLPGRGGLMVTPASEVVLDGNAGSLFLAGSSGFAVEADDGEGRVGGSCEFDVGRCGGGGRGGGTLKGAL